jgi:ketosteroid isomerase-like protein
VLVFMEMGMIFMRLMKMNHSTFLAILFLTLCVSLSSPSVRAQLPDPNAQHESAAAQMLHDPTLSPGKALLFELEARFAKDVAMRGGKAYAEWMADDAVVLGNGEAPTKGRSEINKNSTWTAEQYQLSWTPTDALMGPSGDMGYTWGHYEGHSKDANGFPVVDTGRYMTIWRKQPSGEWKVILDMGNKEPAAAADCCKVVKP